LDPFSCYKTYLALKNHFTKKTYDYHKYCGKSRASIQSFYKRKDRFWFEKLSRNKDDKQIIEFFVSNFVTCADPDSLWIGDIIRHGESNYLKWSGRINALSYVFKSEVHDIFDGEDFDEMFRIKNSRHPKILKMFLQSKVSLETMVILNKIIGYKKYFDSKLEDPIWQFVSMRIDKYDNFIHIDIFHFKKILKEIVA
jgi:hypothetical protein